MHLGAQLELGRARPFVCQGHFPHHSMFSSDFLTSHCLIHLFIQSLFYSSMHSLNSQEICFIRHAHGVLSCPSVYLLPTEILLILQYPCPLLLSQWNLYDVFLFYLLYSYPLMAAHPLLPSSPRMLFVILSCVSSSCSVVLRIAWPYPRVLIPWAYFCVVLKCLLWRHMSYLDVSTFIWECQLSIFWLTEETYELSIVK